MSLIYSLPWGNGEIMVVFGQNKGEMMFNLQFLREKGQKSSQNWEMSIFSKNRGK